MRVSVTCSALLGDKAQGGLAAGLPLRGRACVGGKEAPTTKTRRAWRLAQSFSLRGGVWEASSDVASTGAPEKRIGQEPTAASQP